jgi:disulfide oxidoreductase YuzD
MVGFFAIMGANQAWADNGGIDINVKQELGSNLASANVQIQCAGGTWTAFGVTDASGNISVLQAALPAGANCDTNDEQIDIQVAKDGYVSYQSLAVTGNYQTGSQNTYNITGVQFAHKFIVVDELGTALTPTSATAGANNTACTVSTNNLYCPVPLADDDVLTDGAIIIKDGYVTTTDSNVPLAGDRTAATDAQQVTTMTTTNGLDFSHRVTVKNELNSALTPTTVTAGANNTACTISTNNVYCPVPLADDDTLTDGFVIIKDGYVTTTAANVPLTGDRTVGTDPQNLAVMDATNGLDFSHKFIVVNELGSALTPDSATAGASSVACTISTNNVYCPIVLADDNTLTNGAVIIKDGYVTTTAANVPLAGNRTAGTNAQQLTTMTSTNGLDFAAKATVYLYGTTTVISGATVTAGNSAAISCREFIIVLYLWLILTLQFMLLKQIIILVEIILLIAQPVLMLNRLLQFI